MCPPTPTATESPGCLKSGTRDDELRAWAAQTPPGAVDSLSCVDLGLFVALDALKAIFDRPTDAEIERLSSGERAHAPRRRG